MGRSGRRGSAYKRGLNYEDFSEVMQNMKNREIEKERHPIFLDEHAKVFYLHCLYFYRCFLPKQEHSQQHLTVVLYFL